MRRAVLMAGWVILACALPLSAEEAAAPPPTPPPTSADAPADAAPGQLPAPEAQPAAADEACPTEPHSWETVWGLTDVRVFAAGPKVAPNGQEFHPHSSLDLDFNVWVWRRQGLYLFADMRFWNEKPEYGVTNAKDPAGLGFSKREYDLVGGPAWNYYGPWEARVDCYTLNNLNRGTNLVTPYGLNDGIGLENRYYLSPEYANLGRTGYDVARADFVSAGYYITKDMEGNDGQSFKPGLMLRAYLTQDLWNWPAYAFGDTTFLSDNTLKPKLLLFDVGVAVRPFATSQMFNAWRNWEARVGVENTADLEVHDVLNLWYGSIRIVY